MVEPAVCTTSAGMVVCVSLDAHHEGARTGTRAVLRKFFRKQPRFMLTRGGIEGKKPHPKTEKPSQTQSIQTNLLQQRVFISFLKLLPTLLSSFYLLSGLCFWVFSHQLQQQELPSLFCDLGMP